MRERAWNGNKVKKKKKKKEGHTGIEKKWVIHRHSQMEREIDRETEREREKERERERERVEEECERGQLGRIVRNNHTNLSISKGMNYS